ETPNPTHHHRTGRPVNKLATLQTRKPETPNPTHHHLCPWRQRSSAPVSASQTRTIPSNDPLMMRPPRGSKATLQTGKPQIPNHCPNHCLTHPHLWPWSRRSSVPV